MNQDLQRRHQRVLLLRSRESITSTRTIVRLKPHLSPRAPSASGHGIKCSNCRGFQPVSGPQDDPPRPQAEEQTGQASQHQTHPQQTDKTHAYPVVSSVWCTVPMVGVGYSSTPPGLPAGRYASGHTPTCLAREATDLVSTKRFRIRKHLRRLGRRTMHRSPPARPQTAEAERCSHPCTRSPARS